MKYTYPTELDWMMHREQAKEDGFFIRDGKKFHVLRLDSDEKLKGNDAYEFSGGFLVTAWQRAEIADKVEEEMKIVGADRAQEVFEWLKSKVEEE